MKGLFVKDLLTLKASVKSYILIVLIWTAIGFANGSMGSSLVCILPLMILSSLTSFDERSKFNLFARTMPVSEQNIVQARYLIILFTFAIVILYCTVTSAIISLRGESFSALILTSLSIAVSSALTCPILIPIQYKFGVEKSRIYIMLILVVASLFFGGVTYIFVTEQSAQLSMFLPLLALPLLIVEWIVSYKISVKIHLDKAA